jgi:peptidoglycan/LPS O-acetylase OafA/YrhL
LNHAREIGGLRCFTLPFTRIRTKWLVEVASEVSFSKISFVLFFQCYNITWYLNVDFQLFLITPLLVYPLWRWRKKFFWFLSVLVVLIMACTFTTCYRNGLMAYSEVM